MTCEESGVELYDGCGIEVAVDHKYPRTFSAIAARWIGRAMVANRDLSTQSIEGGGRLLVDRDVAAA